MGVKEQVFRSSTASPSPAPSSPPTPRRWTSTRSPIHQAPAGRGRHALLQPGQRHEAAGSGARRRHRQGRAGHVMQLAKKIKKTAVVSGVCDGFIGNRMIEHYGRVAGFLLEEGATPQQVDKALEKWGMAMGPFRMGDLAGNDIGWAIRKRRYVEKPASATRRSPTSCASRAASARRPARAGTATRPATATPSPTRGRQPADRGLPQGTRASRRARSATRRSSSAASTPWSTRVRASSRKASPPAPPTSTWSTSPATASRCTAAARCSTPTRWASTTSCARMQQRFAAESGDAFWQPAPLLAKLAAAKARPSTDSTEFRRHND
jgi:hypothetical protein